MHGFIRTLYEHVQMEGPWIPFLQLNVVQCLTNIAQLCNAVPTWILWVDEEKLYLLIWSSMAVSSKMRRRLYFLTWLSRSDSATVPFWLEFLFCAGGCDRRRVQVIPWLTCAGGAATVGGYCVNLLKVQTSLIRFLHNVWYQFKIINFGIGLVLHRIAFIWKCKRIVY